MNSSRAIIILTLFLTAIGAAACTSTATPTETAIPSPTRSETPPPSFTPTQVQTATHTPIVPTSTFTPLPRASDTPAPSATFTPIPPTRTPTALALETYSTVPISSAPADRPAAQHADLNLGLRGFASAQAPLGFVEYGDPVRGAPQLLGLTENYRAPKFTSVYRVNAWDWVCNCKGEPIDDWDVTVVGIAMTPGEGVYTPDTGADIFSVYRALVLYAEPSRITIKYSREDTVANGYTIHLEGIAVEPNLLALYQQQNAAGRASLPALKAHQRIGRALGNEIKISVRDAGSFMDPRSRKDWWAGK